MNNFWDEVFSSKDYVYGTAPNMYFKQEIDKLTPGKILLPGEGEGRNAVYAASKGWDVTAIDQSEQGRIKAMELAKEKNVSIKYIVSPLNEYKFPENEFDAVSLIYVHFIPEVRERIHNSIIKSLKTGGKIIIEAFNKKQISNDSGGPKDINALYSIDDLRNEFKNFKIEELSEYKVSLEEGFKHLGNADIIRLIAVKV
jgi:SAM-dependent methyltransferase